MTNLEKWYSEGEIDRLNRRRGATLSFIGAGFIILLLVGLELGKDAGVYFWPAVVLTLGIFIGLVISAFQAKRIVDQLRLHQKYIGGSCGDQLRKLVSIDDLLKRMITSEVEPSKISDLPEFGQLKEWLKIYLKLYSLYHGNISTTEQMINDLLEESQNRLFDAASYVKPFIVVNLSTNDPGNSPKLEVKQQIVSVLRKLEEPSKK